MGPVTVGHPDRRVPCRHGHGFRAGRGEGERHPWLLDAARIRPGLQRAPVAALEGRGSTGQEQVEEVHELAEPVLPFGHAPGLVAEDGGVPTLRACADPDREAPAGEIVEGQELAGERHRVPEGRRRDQGAQPDRGGDHPRRRERGHRREPGRVPQLPPGDVVKGPRMVEAECLGPRPRLGRGGPAVLGQDQHAEAHDPNRTPVGAAPPGTPTVDPHGRGGRSLGFLATARRARACRTR